MVETYKIKKILNNNVVIAEQNKFETILVGKGIGFDFPKGAEIPKDRIENIFVKQTAEIGENYQKVLKSIDNNIVGISEEIIHLAEKQLKVKLNEAIHVSLPDHISFALTRIKKGVNMENPFISELSVLYPEQYKISLAALQIINNRFNINLPEDEAGFICLHIKAALTKKNVGDSLAYTKKISVIMELIQRLTGKKVVKTSLGYTRTVTHINFMIERIQNNKIIKNYLLHTIKKELYTEYNIAIKVAMKIEDLFSIKVPEDEIGYIALHLKRLKE